MLKRTVATALAICSVLTVASPALAATAYPMGTVNIRSGPGTNYGVIGSISDGQRAEIMAHEGSWLKVRTGSGTVGYMADWVTREVFDNETVYVQVNTDVLNLRATPSLDAAVIGQVRQGEQLRLLEGLAGWYKVDAGARGIGWVKAEYTYRVAAPPTTTPPATSPPPSTTPPVEQTPPAPPTTGLVKQVVAMASTSMLVGRSWDYDAVAPVRLWERLTYVDSAEGWVKVQNASGARGWVDGQKLNLTDQGMPFELQAAYNVGEGDWAISYLKVREVNAYGDGLALRQGPSATSPVVRALTPYTRMKILAIPGGEFVQVMLSDGATGWISRNYLKMVPGMPTESLRLQQTAPGVLQLDVAGLTAPGAVSASGNTLQISLAANANRKSSMRVAEYGVDAVAMDAGALTLRFEQPFSYRVVSQGAGGATIEIRPSLQSVARVAGADRETVKFQLAGAVAPSARREGSDIVVTMPGATLGSGLTLPAGVTATATATGVVARVTSNRSYAIKRSGEGFDLVLFAPGLAGKTIVVDPGHGGIETGAIGPAGLVEKELNLAIALKLKAMLEAAGARVLMTRTADTRCATPEQLAPIPVDERLRYDLNCRAELPNVSGADAFVSVHNNANPSRYERGTEVYYAADNLNAPQSRLLAGLAQEDLVRSLGFTNRGVKEEMFYVVKYTDAPAILAEVGFLSNPTEEGLLKQDVFRQAAAQGLFNALQRFFNQQ